MNSFDRSQQGSPNRLPDDRSMSSERRPKDDGESRQTHENRERPRHDHGTGHLGYNKTHDQARTGPVVEGSDKI